MPGPAQCHHCSRAIYPQGYGWVHGHNGRAVCYAPNGDRLTAAPRGSVDTGGITAHAAPQTPSESPAP